MRFPLARRPPDGDTQVRTDALPVRHLHGGDHLRALAHLDLRKGNAREVGPMNRVSASMHSEALGLEIQFQRGF